MKTNELREMYLDFFEQQGCQKCPSDVLVPRWDPSVLFTPAGMNQFKDHFLGRCKLDFTKATTCQKCLRTGDIENVGKTAYHHTFFEMLGNFSFGDYFKREAISWAWEFLTSKKWLAIPAEKLSVTVYLDDDEAHDIWEKEIGLPTSRIERLDEDENFWPASAPSQGPDGVCGPCSEIYYHHPEFGEVEIWNLVFTQFNRVGDPPNNLSPLPSRNIDTGMGLERTAAVLQNVSTNYHIDSLRPLVEAASDLFSLEYVPESDEGRRFRRIADHVRACTFAIHENVYPGPNKEKYVIKRLLRRAVLDGRQMGKTEPFLYQLVGKVAELMAAPYPELGETITRVAEVIEAEEANFLGTIDGGLDRIGRIFKQMQADNESVVAGGEIADMYQTFGFPPELFETLAAEHNFTFDWDGYNAEMEQHGQKSGGGKVELFKHDPLEGIKKSQHRSKFLGYEELTIQGAKVLGIVSGKALVDCSDEVNQKQPITVVLNQTPFYGEMGGQVGDTGTLEGDQFKFEVIDSQMDGELTLHLGHLREGVITTGDEVTAVVNHPRRAGVARAHSATHLLHCALQKVLGEHAQQQGSKVDDDLLRFDFSNQKAVTSEQLLEIENLVNANILNGGAISAEVKPLADARQEGAMMLFGEKYPDPVRVVSTGDYWKELCGGTHLNEVSKIGLMKIVSEESVSAGVRRITALTGVAALDFLRNKVELLAEAANSLKIPPEQLPQRTASLTKEIKQLKKDIEKATPSEKLSAKSLAKEANAVTSEKTGSEIKVITKEVTSKPNEMREVIDQLRRDFAPVAVFLGAKQGASKVMLFAGLSPDLVEAGYSAADWVGEVAPLVGGGGGGRADMAQAGGKKPEQLGQAIAKATEVLK